MKPDNETIEKFRKIYSEEFGEEISKEEAYEKFRRLVSLLRAILKKPSTSNPRPDSSGPLSVDEHCRNAKLKE